MASSRATTTPATTSDHLALPGAPTRVSFAKIREPLRVPDLLDLQTQSFEWLVGDEAWFQRRLDAGDENPVGGLEEILTEISPIEDFSGSMSLSFSDPRFDEVKASVEECKDKDMTYAAPLFVTAEFTNNTTGEIKSQTVFMGDFPVMTDKGTFIINGTERVVVSQLVRSPGIYFDHSIDKTTEKDVYSVKIIPSRGAWLEFDVDKRDTVGVRIDRKRRQPVTVLLKALGWSAEQIQQRFGFSETMIATLEKDHTAGQDEALLDIYRKLRPGEPPTRESAQTLLENLFFKDKRYDLAKVGRYKANKKLGLSIDTSVGTLTEDDIGTTIEYLVRLHAGEKAMSSARRRRDPGRDRRHRPLRQPAPAHRGRADPEPDPGRPLAHGAGRPRADDHPGRRGDHAADPDQHSAGRGCDQGVLRHVPAVAVHGPDQPAGRPDAQAASVRAGSGRPVPRAGRLRGPRRAPQPLRPHVPDRDPGRPEHRPDRVAVQLRAGQPVRLHPDAVPQGGRRVATEQIDYLTADEEDRFVIAQANEPLADDGSFTSERVLVRRKGGEVDYIPRRPSTTSTSRRGRWCRSRPR